MSDGHHLFYRRWLTKRDHFGVILAIHGTGAHSGFFRVLGEDLSSSGVETYAPDLRGFGRSTEKELPRGDTRSFRRHLADIQEVITIVRERSGEKPFLLGHSHGCATALWYAAKNPDSISGIILAAPPVEATSKVRKREYLKFAVALLFAPKTMYRFPDLKSRDGERIEQTDILANDPLSTRSFSIRWLYGSKKMLFDPMFQHASQTKTPVMILQGDADTVTLESGAKRLFEEIGALDKTAIIFPEADNFLYGSILPLVSARGSVENRGKMTATITDWIKSR